MTVMRSLDGDNRGQPTQSRLLPNALLFSVLLHISVLIVAVFGLPYLPFDRSDVRESAIVVDLVQIGEMTAAPPPSSKTKPEAAQPLPKAEPPKPKPSEPPPPKADLQPPKAEPPKPKPSEPPPPKADLQPPKAEPPKPKPSEPPPPKADPQPPKAEPPKPKPEIRKPEAKPVKPVEDDPFMSLMQNVEKFRTESKAQATQQETESLPVPPTPSPSVRNAAVAEQATISEIDAIRHHIENNWLIDPGIQGGSDMVIALRVLINRDGSVSDVRIEDMGRYNSDPVYRALTESAMRAVKKSVPLPYPAEKYETFRDIVLSFRPKGRVQ